MNYSLPGRTGRAQGAEVRLGSFRGSGASMCRVEPGRKGRAGRGSSRGYKIDLTGTPLLGGVDSA